MLDSHSHIYSHEFDDDRDLVIARAREVGVRHIVLPNENRESVPRLVATRDAYPGYISIALGLHPEDVDAGYEAVLAAMRPLLDEHQPVAVNALDEILSVMDNFGETLPQGVFHSFTGTPQEVEQVRRRGDFYFGVNGIVTFKKSEVKEILPVVGLDRLLLETDSPYLAPVPNRGKRNESANIPYICNYIAEYLGVSPSEVSASTDRNAINLFNLHIQ